MDFAGPLSTTKSGKKYLLIAVEHLAGWPVVRAVEFQTSSVAIQFFQEEAVRKFGSPSVIPTDNGPAFSSVAWTDALASVGTNARRVAPYSPQSSGKAERMVRTMKTAITKILQGSREDWEDTLMALEGSYRARKIADGYSPFFLMYGKESQHPGIAIPVHASFEKQAKEGSDVNAALREAALLVVEAHRADRLTNLEERVLNPFNVGDVVAVRKIKWQSWPALTSKWSGPFVLNKADGIRCWLKDSGGRVTRDGVHIRRLKRYIVRNCHAGQRDMAHGFLSTLSIPGKF